MKTLIQKYFSFYKNTPPFQSRMLHCVAEKLSTPVISTTMEGHQFFVPPSDRKHLLNDPKVVERRKTYGNKWVYTTSTSVPTLTTLPSHYQWNPARRTSRKNPGPRLSLRLVPLRSQSKKTIFLIVSLRGKESIGSLFIVTLMKSMAIGLSESGTPVVRSDKCVIFVFRVLFDFSKEPEAKENRGGD